jgi:glucose dehydrogenase
MAGGECGPRRNALDAATGNELWKFDPRADPRAARNPCCDLVNRGVAVWKGRVFVADALAIRARIMSSALTGPLRLILPP